ncbi:hypothetical protein G3O08_18985 [Cryomorpha ignava]|uniref:Uncharacterized protein n=1 Tax=Cryomorpha ignava TaxID=101383 RepID=A0A7K3WXK1_9FLAO|nr:hypothetical protein [Cryomorpha ignava]NEN25582.1 hypothetical protein [Cryomorpha ignava]
MFENINLKAELFKIRENKAQQEIDETLEAFKDLFRADWEKENRINQNLSNGSKAYYFPNSTNLDSDKIFDISAIKRLCIKYRLRFLPTKYFKANFPIEAMRAIKDTEQEHHTEIKNFMIIAPSALFKLEDANKDPLLFVPLENNKFYLIHQWGNDLSWYRRFMAWPLKSFSKLVSSIVFLSILTASLIPGFVISSSVNYFSFGRLLFAIWLMLSISAIVSFLWFTLNQKFSKDAWNSHTFN